MKPEVLKAFNQLSDRMKKQLRPSLRIRTSPLSQDQLSPGQSRIGGLPDLPKGFQWPKYKGVSLSFVCQLNLAELAKYGKVLPLPKSGSLVFFYDSEQRAFGFDPKDRGSALVSYIPKSKGPLKRRGAPEEISDEMSEAGPFQCCSLAFAVEEILPDNRALQYVPELSQSEENLLLLFQEIVHGNSREPRHRLGGYPDLVQNPMELECQLAANGWYCGYTSDYSEPRARALAPGALDWRLLLQIDSDENASMMWGDVGRLYYWLHEDDLAAKSFDECWLILQGH